MKVLQAPDLLLWLFYISCAPTKKTFINSHSLVDNKMHMNSNKAILIASSIYLVFFFALGSGLFNSILEGSERLSGSFIIPSRSIQTVAETVVMIIIFLLGTSGVYLLYKGGISQAPIKNQGAFMAAGFVIIGIALVLGFRIIDIKL
jgi:hypothetical protein